MLIIRRSGAGYVNRARLKSGLTLGEPRCPQTNFIAIGDRTPPSVECSLGGVRFHGRAMKSPSKPSLREHQHEVLLMRAK
jgi:hypothetical protein